MTTHLDRFAPFTPSEDDKALAAESSRRLAPHVRRPRKLTLQVKGQKGAEVDLVLPAGAVKLLQTILTEIARGNAITAIPLQAQLTTQQAADLLNVSRPHLIGLLDKGEIPHHRSGLTVESPSRTFLSTSTRLTHAGKRHSLNSPSWGKNSTQTIECDDLLGTSRLLRHLPPDATEPLAEPCRQRAFSRGLD